MLRSRQCDDRVEDPALDRILRYPITQGGAGATASPRLALGYVVPRFQREEAEKAQLLNSRVGLRSGCHSKFLP